MDGPPSVAAGQQEANYTIAVGNATNRPLTNVQLALKVDQVVIEKADREIKATGNPGEYFWDIPQIAPGTALTKYIQVSVPTAVARQAGEIAVRVLSDQYSREEVYSIPIDESQIRQRPITRPTAHSVRTMHPVANQRRAAFDAKKGLQMQILATEMVRTNEPIDYEIIVRNDRRYSFRNLQLSVRVDRGMKYVELGAPIGSRSNITQDGRLIEFSTIRELMPNENLIYRVRAKSARRGDVRFAGQLFATGLEEPIAAQQEVRVN